MAEMGYFSDGQVVMVGGATGISKGGLDRKRAYLHPISEGTTQRFQPCILISPEDLAAHVT